jgi:CRP-like cAMP-binding protein
VCRGGGQAAGGQGYGEREPVARLAPVSLLEVLPEIVSTIPPEDRELAERTLMAPRLVARDIDLAATLAETGENGFDFLVIEGVVLKETRLSNRAALELLGPGDVLGPPLSAPRQIESRAVSRYVAHGTVTLAELGARFRAAARRWPGLSDILLDRLARQTHRASMHLAMLHLPRVQDRIVALFSDLAERFGQMTPEGALIDVDLTHEVIGGLVGSRRPTVSIALQVLAAEGTLVRHDDARWTLHSLAV